MNRADFGKLIAALRRGNADWEGVWTQQKLANESGVSISVVANIETGRKATLEPETLSQLADGLRLSPLEYEQLLLLSIDSKKQEEQEAETSYDYLQAVLETACLLHTPLVIHDGLYRIIAANTAWLQLHQLSEDMFQNSLTGNLLHLIHHPSSPLRAALKDGLAGLIAASTRHFRYISLPHRHTDNFAELFRSLMQYSSFERGWNQIQPEDGRRNTIRAFAYSHSIYGDLRYIVSHNNTRTDDGNIYLSILTAASAATSELFTQLCDSRGRTLVRDTSYFFPNESSS